jgi:hypothetical protein
MAFDWELFFKRNNIRYVTSGKNTKSGEFSIPCVWCNRSGNKDPSEHLGVNPETGAFSCWRNNKHRGNNAVYLIKQILDCSFKEALEIYGVKEIDISALGSILDKLKSESAPVPFQGPEKIALPANTYSIEKNGSFLPYFNYLIERGFDEEDVPRLVTDYDLRCAITGPWAGRVILPVTYQGELTSWTARAIHDAPDRLRYMNTHKEDSVRKQTDSLYLYDECMNDERHDTLYVLEGPFDALKLDFYGKDHGVRSVAMFTNNLTETQRLLVSNLCDTFKEVFIMLDTGWFHQSMSLASQITASNIRAKKMVDGFKDVGEMTKPDIITYFTTKE